ncbi:hypothetical protein HK103_005121 [Boothiomyces macroporosus]|uniref:Uncharacterized protein n=1 Tax=Boothiomyces macroporosus TaxID=261099 RepID=A0AAD5Y3H9_9FUNG|nr:hypothetical protein HK103_005121 [Boothiomyces macroporosus]
MKHSYHYLNPTLFIHQDENTFTKEQQFKGDNLVDSTYVSLNFYQSLNPPLVEDIDFLFKEFINEEFHPHQQDFRLPLPTNDYGFTSEPTFSTASSEATLEEQSHPFPTNYTETQLPLCFFMAGDELTLRKTDNYSQSSSFDDKSEDQSDDSRFGSPLSIKSSPIAAKVEQVRKKTKNAASMKTKFSLLFKKAEKVDLGVFVMTKCPCCPKLFKALRGFTCHISKDHSTFI